MDWTGVVEKNQGKLRRILAMLVAMAGLDGAFTSPLWGGRREASGGGSSLPVTPTRRSDDRRPPHKGEVETGERPTLPRRLHRAVLRLLRPLESATRRLIIVAARDIVVTLPPSRPRKPKPDLKAVHAALRRLGIAVVMSPADIARAAAEKRAAEKRAAARANRPPSLPLLDPLQRPFRSRRRTVPPHAAPRILSFDGAVPHRLPPPPSRDDPVDATRLRMRFQALARALDDLPGHARRFARWKAFRKRNRQSSGANRFIRISPLRPGLAPGLSRANRRRPSHEVHEVLADLQYFAWQALEQPDTS